ncbi:DSD1 family PLP-dependent enzyme [Lunatibacter salilacus]|uniref:DSD1 family PLP-dependent enzyme n=1 Tax=Lunatibacter salilacus TaxID=2483804 RepID=UPI00131B2377|nr:DSD1 family PLP-dependent enzyme [Lunatibacter salilacus]
MSSTFNRRKFLQTSAVAGAAMLWSPKLHASQLPDALSAEIGKSKWDLDSPALLLDLDKLEFNLKAVSAPLAGTRVGVRPHVKTHKCPAIAKMQIDAGAVGVCAAKLSESEVMLENGISNVLMTGVNVTKPKIIKAMEIRKKYPGFIQAVDNPQNAQDLQDAAKAAGIIADVVVDIDVIKRSGVPAGEPALALAQLVDKLPNLRFRGILAYDGGVQHVKGFKARKTRAFKTFEPVVESYELIKSSGLNLEIFSGGGTGTYDMMHEIPGFTDGQVGSYVFMDCQYLEIGGAKNEDRFDDFEASLTVLTTIINANYPNRLVTDSGAKSFTLNKPTGWVVGEPDFLYNAGSDEYGTISFENANKTYRVGDKLEVIVPHCDPVVNLYDFMYGIRNEKVESILPILARGKSQ